MSYTQSFELAVDHAMLYEVGGYWKLTKDVELGLVNTYTQRRAVGYTNDPRDRGGETKFGIAKNANPSVDVYKLTWDQAKSIYYAKYWLGAKCNNLPGRLAALQFDGAVNHGPKKASQFIQRALGLVDDGAIGPVTLSAISNADEILLCNMVCDKREEFYRAIVANDASQGVYLNGWLRRISEIRAFVTDLSRVF